MNIRDTDLTVPGIGGVFFIPSGILHALAAGDDAALLALWLLDLR